MARHNARPAGQGSKRSALGPSKQVQQGGSQDSNLLSTCHFTTPEGAMRRMETSLAPAMSLTLVFHWGREGVSPRAPQKLGCVILGGEARER